MDLDNFDPQNEKENYGDYENIDQYAAQSSQTALGNGYPENTPPPEMQPWKHLKKLANPLCLNFTQWLRHFSSSRKC